LCHTQKTLNYNIPVGKITKKAVCRSAFLLIPHSKYSAIIPRIHSNRLLFRRFYPLGSSLKFNLILILFNTFFQYFGRFAKVYAISKFLFSRTFFRHAKVSSLNPFSAGPLSETPHFDHDFFSTLKSNCNYRTNTTQGFVLRFSNS